MNEDDDRQKYIIPGEKITYAHVTSTLVDMPMLPTKLTASSLSPTSPVPKPTELVHQTISQSEQVDIAGKLHILLGKNSFMQRNIIDDFLFVCLFDR